VVTIVVGVGKMGAKLLRCFYEGLPLARVVPNSGRLWLPSRNGTRSVALPYSHHCG
jgi:hypothetical protein